MPYVEYLPGEKFAGSNPDISDFHEGFKDCGLLLTKSDIVVDIDCLPRAAIEELINVFNIHTQTVWTDRGVHFYFSKEHPNVKANTGTCTLGFKVEHLTSANRPNGITVKRNGIMREMEKQGIRQVLPKIFKVKSRNPFADLLGLDEAEGRNMNLFKFRKTLIREGFKSDELLKILGFINKWVFATPLPESEFQTVTRETETDETLQQGSVKFHTVAAKAMVDELRAVRWNKSIWFWDGQKYVRNEGVAGSSELDRLIIRKFDNQDSAFCKEVVKQIDLRSDSYSDHLSFPIRLAKGGLHNGEYDPEISDSDFTPYFIDIVYDPNAEPVQIVDDYINNLTNGDEEYKKLLLEIMSYPMITDPAKIASISKCFFIRGNGKNGKGTLLKILNTIYGRENVVSIGLKQLKDRTFTCNLPGKLINLCDDVENVPIDDEIGKMIKNITSADNITTRSMFKDAVEVTVTAKLFFTTNFDLSTWEKDFAMKRRMMWLPMFGTVEKPDPQFLNKITTPAALKYWMRLLVEAYERLYENNEFTFSKKVQEFTEEYHQKNDKYRLFIEDVLVPENLELVLSGSKSHEIGKLYRETYSDKFVAKSFHEALKEFGWEYVKTFNEGWHYRKLT